MAATVTPGPTHGKDAVIYLAGLDYSGEARSFSVSNKCQIVDKTGMGGSAVRIFQAGLKSWDGNVSALFLAGSADDPKEVIIDKHLAKSGIWVFGPHGDEIGRLCGYAEFGRFEGYDLSSPVEGLTELSAPVIGDGPFEWGKVHQVKATISSFPHEPDSVDGLAQTTAGGVGFLIVFAITGGTSIQPTIQDSANDSAWSDLVTFATMVQATAPSSERVALGSGATVERYTRFECAETGGVTSVVIHAGFQRG